MKDSELARLIAKAKELASCAFDEDFDYEEMQACARELKAAIESYERE